MPAQYDAQALAMFEKTLSDLEFTVAKYVADGLSNPEIAEQTNYSYGYIKRVVSTVLEKENMRKRSDIRRYLKEGVYDEDSDA